MARRKIIIDTDPGVDDILAILLAVAAKPEELEVLLISVTYGNVEVHQCLRNVVSLFHHVEKETAWRRQRGLPAGFESIQKSRPLVAVGPEHPLAEDILMADYFHGRDGLGGISESHPHLSIDDTWKTLFDETRDQGEHEKAELVQETTKGDALFKPSKDPAHQEILRLLRENETDTITIVAVGPLTNLALAAAEDPEAFLRVHEVVVMGGNVEEAGNVGLQTSLNPRPNIREPPFRLIKAPPGPIRNLLNERNQITPVAEFNTYADTTAAARVYALTSPNPQTTMPPSPPVKEGQHLPHYLKSYPPKLSRPLKVTMFPVDITNKHLIKRDTYRQITEPLIASKSPLAEWIAAFMTATFKTVESLSAGVEGDAVGLQLHDPLCVWYCIAGHEAGWKLIKDEDIRVETSGQWTRGMCVIDKRSRKKREDKELGEIVGDKGNWLSSQAGNRVGRCVQTPSEETFGEYMLKRIFGI
ncbi:putative nucleoside hydrolase [Teratosphaeria nubilosa]|uniref:Putative nucleoside hydrolase n=1 Tax=Teratosphaeria nubilosa TaxID=161662 RepID=A0A6G1LGT4_9PEZI|nr:putative nucleoside hydrolase [Teratosphaeria nubilosa]